MKIAGQATPIFGTTTINTRKTAKRYPAVQYSANEGWIDRLAKLSIVLLAMFAYTALTTDASKDTQSVEKNRQVWEQSMRKSEVYLGKVPVANYIKHRAGINQSE